MATKIGIAFVLALLLPLSITLWSVFAPPLLKGHVDAFIWPFILDNAFTAPDALEVAKLAVVNGQHPYSGHIAIVTGCTVGGLGAHTAAILAGVANMTVVCAGRSASKLTAAAATVAADFPNAPAVVGL